MSMQTSSTTSTSPGVPPNESQVEAGPFRGLRDAAANVLETAVGLLETGGRAVRDSLKGAVAALRGEGADAGAIDQENNVGRPSGTQTGDQIIQAIEINAYKQIMLDLKTQLLVTALDLKQEASILRPDGRIELHVNFVSTCSQRLQGVLSVVEFFAFKFSLNEGEGDDRLRSATRLIARDRKLRDPINEFRGDIKKFQKSLSDGRLSIDRLHDFCNEYQKVFEDLTVYFERKYQVPISDLLEAVS